VLVLLAEAFLTAGLEAVYSEYAFAVYPIAVQAAGARARVAPALPAGHEQALGHDLDAMRGLVGPETRLVFIANPNNPTGTWVDGADLERFIAAMPGHVLVVVDEAYFEYSRGLGLPDCTVWLDEFPNLVVSRTFSKVYGLAGIRIGYTLSSPGVADMLNRVRQPFNVNSLALLGAVAALGDGRFVSRSVAGNAQGVKQLRDGLLGLGIRCGPTAGNFVLADMGRPAMPVYDALLKLGIIVRPVGNYGLPDHLRMTVGTEEQNEALLQALAIVARDGLIGEA
jgi:histidinol-phosphate aminotransferase